MSHRKQQVESLLKRVVSEVLTRKLSDPRVIGLVSVTRVEVSQGATADLIAVSPETRAVIPGRERKNTLITGSHILNLTRARAALAPHA